MLLHDVWASQNIHQHVYDISSETAVVVHTYWIPSSSIFSVIIVLCHSQYCLGASLYLLLCWLYFIYWSGMLQLSHTKSWSWTSALISLTLTSKMRFTAGNILISGHRKLPLILGTWIVEMNPSAHTGILRVDTSNLTLPVFCYCICKQSGISGRDSEPCECNHYQ